MRQARTTAMEMQATRTEDPDSASCMPPPVHPERPTLPPPLLPSSCDRRAVERGRGEGNAPASVQSPLQHGESIPMRIPTCTDGFGAEPPGGRLSHHLPLVMSAAALARMWAEHTKVDAKPKVGMSVVRARVRGDLAKAVAYALAER